MLGHDYIDIGAMLFEQTEGAEGFESSNTSGNCKDDFFSM
jgi:hypothetical protein